MPAKTRETGSSHCCQGRKFQNQVFNCKQSCGLFAVKKAFTLRYVKNLQIYQCISPYQCIVSKPRVKAGNDQIAWPHYSRPLEALKTILIIEMQEPQHIQELYLYNNYTDTQHTVSSGYMEPYINILYVDVQACAFYLEPRCALCITFIFIKLHVFTQIRAFHIILYCICINLHTKSEHLVFISWQIYDFYFTETLKRTLTKKFVGKSLIYHLIEKTLCTISFMAFFSTT